jgi:hypothetical protein
VTAGVDQLVEVDVSVLPGAEALVAAEQAEVLIRRLQAFKLRAVARASQTRAAHGRGAPGVAHVLHAQGVRPGEAKREVLLAERLDSHALTAEAMSTGEISAQHAAVITHTTGQLPPHIRHQGEARLVEAAKTMDPGELRKEGVRVVNDLHPQGPELLQEREERNRRRREFALVPHGEGYAVTGWLDVETAAVVSAVVEAYAAPKPAGQDGPDPRTPAQRRGDALAEAFTALLDAGRLPSTGSGIHVFVTMTLDQLTGASLATADLTGGTITEPISAGAARRLAARAGTIPVVLGGDSEILDLGRTKRHATRAQRRALLYRDRTCTANGCDRPATWTDAHHQTPWSRGGPTDLDNLTLHCGFHHTQAHRDLAHRNHATRDHAQHGG